MRKKGWLIARGERYWRGRHSKKKSYIGERQRGKERDGEARVIWVDGRGNSHKQGR